MNNHRWEGIYPLTPRHLWGFDHCTNDIKDEVARVVLAALAGIVTEKMPSVHGERYEVSYAHVRDVSMNWLRSHATSYADNVDEMVRAVYGL